MSVQVCHMDFYLIDQGRERERVGEVMKQRKLHHQSSATQKGFAVEIHLCLSLSPLNYMM